MPGDLPRLLIGRVLDGSIRDREQLQREKIRLCRRCGLESVPPNSEILAAASPEERAAVGPLLQKKPVKAVGGVAVVAVMTSPHPCPHGRCVYCPGGVENGSPQSYTGKEPAARRAARNGYDPAMQVADRLAQLEAIGHRTDRVDLIVMGGTFTSRDEGYQEWFVRRCFDALNGRDAPDVETAQEWNESSEHRCVGMTVETRPDVFDGGQVARAMALGATRVELGVQMLDDTVLAGVSRGHGVREVAEATARSRGSGLAVCYHLMPGLPGSSPAKDMESFRRAFSDPAFRPDALKFYTTLVIPGTGLYDMWRSGLYEPYGADVAVPLIADMKAEVPEYVRIQRVQRDIPAPQIAAGILKSNLRQLVQARLAETGRSCRCIRCREAGRAGVAGPDVPDAEMSDLAYEASGGTEHFISACAGGSLAGYVRLRTDGSSTASVRELRALGARPAPCAEALLREAERIAAESGAERVRATCGAGDRPRYRAAGYRLERPYMVKPLAAR